MPDEIKEEVIEEEKQEETTDVAQDVKDAHDVFDAKLDGEETKKEETDGDEKNTAEDDAEESADDKQDSEDSSGKEAEEKTESKDEAVDYSLVRRAIEAGLDDGMIAKFKDNATLEAAISLVESRKADEGEEETEDEKFDCGLDPEEVAPEIVDAINKMGGDLTKQLKSVTKENETLKAQLAEKNSAGEAEAQQAVVKQIDGLFSQAEDFTELFGEGEGQKLDAESKQLQNRVKVLEEMDALQAGYSQKGKNIPINEVFDRAVRNVFKEESENVAIRRTGKKLEARKQQTIGKPKSGGNKTVTGSQKALQANMDFDAKLDE